MACVRRYFRPVAIINKLDGHDRSIDQVRISVVCTEAFEPYRADPVVRYLERQFVVVAAVLSDNTSVIASMLSSSLEAKRRFRVQSASSSSTTTTNWTRAAHRARAQEGAQRRAFRSSKFR